MHNRSPNHFSTMKKLLQSTAILVLLFALSTAVSAQKFGYIDSNGLLAEMPEVKEMRSKLQALQTQLQKQAEKMLLDMQTKQQEAAQKDQQGELSPLQKETIIKELQADQENYLKYEKEMQQKMLDKEQELLNPILERVNTAIQETAAAEGFTYIFDASVLLYADQSVNVMPFVQKRLGIAVTTPSSPSAGEGIDGMQKK